MAAPTAIARPQRWDRPFGPEMANADVARVLDLPLFRDIDPEGFPAGQGLADIIRNDARIVPYRRGDVVVRQGDYGNSLFIVASGSVRVVVDETRDAELGRHTSRRRRGVFEALRQLWANADEPEARDLSVYRDVAVRVRGDDADARTSVEDVDAFVGKHNTVQLGPGEFFGEIAALARTPRSATVVVEADADLVELRWQGLRDIRRRDPGFRAFIDGRYRERSLKQHMAEAPLFAHLDETALQEVVENTLFETHGTHEWFAGFKRLREQGADEVAEQEPTVIEEGHYLDGLIMIRSGFARVSERLDQGQRTVSYATVNETFGLEEIADHWRTGADLVARRSLRAVGYVDILRVPTALIEKHVLPSLPARLLPAPAAARSSDPAWQERSTDAGLEQSLLDFLVDSRTINGTATMLIDVERCIACDDCVRACASTHDNNPRFKRHGATHGHLQVTNACMHCADPVCLIGCPTGAIHRHETGPVVIDDATCIGCGTCANSCPYDNISMVEIRDSEGGFVVDEATGAPIVKATKCDLCYDQLGGPACQRACPHDALIRIDMRDRARLADWVYRS